VRQLSQVAALYLMREALSEALSEALREALRGYSERCARVRPLNEPLGWCATIRRNQAQSRAIRRDQAQSGAIESDQAQSGAIKRNQRITAAHAT